MTIRETAPRGVIGPTTEEIEELRKGLPKKKNWKIRLLQSPVGKIVGGTFAAAAGLGGAQVIDPEALPRTAGIVRQVPEVMGALLTQKGIIKNPDVFDNNRDYGKVGPRNSVSAPLELVTEQTKIEKGQSLQLGWFFQTPYPADITYIKGLPYTYTIEAKNEKEKELYKRYERVGVQNTIAFTDIPEGTIVRSPFKGKISRTATQWSDVYLNLTLIFTDDDGKWYNLLFTGAKDVEILARAPKLDPNKPFDHNSGLDVEIGDPLFKIQSKELVGGPTGFSYPSQLRLEAVYGPNGFGKVPWVPIDISFITQDNKIVFPTS